MFRLTSRLFTKLLSYWDCTLHIAHATNILVYMTLSTCRRLPVWLIILQIHFHSIHWFNLITANTAENMHGSVNNTDHVKGKDLNSKHYSLKIHRYNERIMLSTPAWLILGTDTRQCIISPVSAARAPSRSRGAPPTRARSTGSSWATSSAGGSGAGAGAGQRTSPPCRSGIPSRPRE